MNWSSVKNLLIAILIAANAFLIFNIVRQDRIRGYIPEAEVEGAAELLTQRGLSVSKDIIPLKRFDAAVYESIYSEQYYTESAEALSASRREMLYTLPGGGISISTQNGSVVDFDTEFGFRYASAAILDADAYTDITADSFFSASDNKTLPLSQVKVYEVRVDEFLSSRIADDSPLGVSVVAAYADGDATYLLARQTLGEHELYSHFAMCAFVEGELVYAHGRWYFGDVGEDYRAELCDQVSILFTDMQTLRESSAHATADEDTSESSKNESGKVENYGELPVVTVINPCYATYWNPDKTALYFIPAWQIEHDNSLVIVYNAVNGTVYLKNQ